jgi:hypothetical protein
MAGKVSSGVRRARLGIEDNELRAADKTSLLENLGEDHPVEIKWTVSSRPGRVTWPDRDVGTHPRLGLTGNDGEPSSRVELERNKRRPDARRQCFAAFEDGQFAERSNGFGSHCSLSAFASERRTARR